MITGIVKAFEFLQQPHNQTEVCRLVYGNNKKVNMHRTRGFVDVMTPILKSSRYEINRLGRQRIRGLLRKSGLRILKLDFQIPVSFSAIITKKTNNLTKPYPYSTRIYVEDKPKEDPRFNYVYRGKTTAAYTDDTPVYDDEDVKKLQGCPFCGYESIAECTDSDSGKRRCQHCGKFWREGNIHVYDLEDREVAKFISDIEDFIDYADSEPEMSDESGARKLLDIIESGRGRLLLHIDDEFWSDIQKILENRENMSPRLIHSICSDKLLAVFLRETKKTDAEYQTAEFKSFLTTWTIRRLKEKGCTARNFMKVMRDIFRNHKKDPEMMAFLDSKRKTRLS